MDKAVVVLQCDGCQALLSDASFLGLRGRFEVSKSCIPRLRVAGFCWLSSVFVSSMNLVSLLLFLACQHVEMGFPVL